MRIAVVLYVVGVLLVIVEWSDFIFVGWVVIFVFVIVVFVLFLVVCFGVSWVKVFVFV